MPVNALSQLGYKESELDLISRALQADNHTLDSLATQLCRPRSSIHHAAVVVAREILGEELGLVAPRFLASAQPMLAAREARLQVMITRQRIIKGLKSIREDLGLYEYELEQKARLKVSG